MPSTVHDLEEVLRKHWYDEISGIGKEHRVFRHQEDPVVLVVAGAAEHEIPRLTMAQIRRVTGLTAEDLP